MNCRCVIFVPKISYTTNEPRLPMRTSGADCIPECQRPLCNLSVGPPRMQIDHVGYTGGDYKVGKSYSIYLIICKHKNVFFLKKKKKYTIKCIYNTAVLVNTLILSFVSYSYIFRYLLAK